MSKGVTKCFEALERIKANKPVISKFIDLPRNKVTAAVISQEAGFDSGYLKKNRPQHQEVISLIESYRAASIKSTLSTKEKFNRERRKVERLQARLGDVEGKLYQSLARELLLLDQIEQLEKKLKK
ncbi:hypothetical protein [Pseudoalteromonas sp. T1lg75]|uniref:hypothetical protein n=1 Tax=Pseudoalteromonas sp. T1lg75 TaxID=2077102 RepID=UPI000CF6868C|nr:hypothetical protein [Pseudoalteromonas sp. T1lg75]